MAAKKNKTVSKGASLKRLLVSLFLGANLCTIGLLWTCVLTTYVSPSTVPQFYVIGLVFPFLLLANVVFVFFWLLFKARMVWVPLLGLAVIGSFALDYCPMNMGGDDSTDSTLCLLSYNAGNVSDDEARASMTNFIRTLSPDVICLQEASGSWYNRLEYDKWCDSLGYQKVCSNSRYIFSRHPILGDTLHLPYSTRGGNGTLACWISYQGDSVLVINNHLESNHLTTEDKSEYKKMIIEHEKHHVRQEGRMLVGKLNEAASYRGNQADTLCAILDSYEGKSVICCGDFNDTPISYTYRRISGKLPSAFREKGFGPGITYNQRGFYVRIDHVFYSTDWECRKCSVEDTLTASDHYPVITYLHKKQQ